MTTVALACTIPGTPQQQGSKTRNAYGTMYEANRNLKPWRAHAITQLRAAWAGEMGAARGRTGSMGFKAATISGFFRCRFHSGELSGAWCARQTRCTGRKNQSRIRLAEGVAPSAVLTVHCVQFESDSRSNLWNFWS